jgi:acetyl esterase/lipase
MRTMAELLTRAGFVGFSVDYRLFDGKRNAWMAQLDHVQRAVRWIRANAAKYNVQPDHIGAFGHSAGAQLAALLGMEETRDNSDPALAKYSSKVQAVVDVSGPSDFTRDYNPDGNAFFAQFLNHQPPSAASPVDHISKSTAPFLIVHGTRDEMVSIDQSQELADKLKKNGVPVKFVKVDDAHTFTTPAARRRLAIETVAFFEQYLVPGQ